MFSLRQTLASIVEKASNPTAAFTGTPNHAPSYRHQHDLSRATPAPTQDQIHQRWSEVLTWYNEKGFFWVLGIKDGESHGWSRSVPTGRRGRQRRPTDLMESTNLRWDGTGTAEPRSSSSPPTARRHRSSSFSTREATLDSTDELYSNAIPNLIDTPIERALVAIHALILAELVHAESPTSVSVPISRSLNISSATSLSRPASISNSLNHLASATNAYGSHTSLADANIGPCLEYLLNGDFFSCISNMARENIPISITPAISRFLHHFLLDVGLRIHTLLAEATFRQPLLTLLSHLHTTARALRADTGVAARHAHRVVKQAAELDLDYVRLVGALVRNLHAAPSQVVLMYESHEQVGDGYAFPLATQVAQFACLAGEVGFEAREAVLMLASFVGQVPGLEGVLGTNPRGVDANFYQALARNLRLLVSSGSAARSVLGPCVSIVDYFAFINHVCLVLPATAAERVSDEARRILYRPPVACTDSERQDDDVDTVANVIPHLIVTTPTCHPSLFSTLVATLTSTNLSIPTGVNMFGNSSDQHIVHLLPMVLMYARLLSTGDAQPTLPHGTSLFPHVADYLTVQDQCAQLMRPAIRMLAARYHPDMVNVTSASVPGLRAMHAGELAADELCAVVREVESELDGACVSNKPNSGQVTVNVPLQVLADMWLAVATSHSSCGENEQDPSSPVMTMESPVSKFVLALATVWRAVILHSANANTGAVMEWVYWTSRVLDASVLDGIPFGDARVGAEWQLEMGVVLWAKYTRWRAGQVMHGAGGVGDEEEEVGG